MKSKEKCCFVFRNDNLGKEFAKELQRRLGVVVQGNYSYAGYLVCVDITAYAHAVHVGTKILMSNQSYWKHGCWVDYYNEIQSPNVGIVMYGFLPSDRKVSREWSFKAPNDIFKFKAELSVFLGKEVYITCNIVDNAVNVHVKEMSEHRTIKRDIKKFLQNHDTPFEKIKFFNYVGKLI